MVNLNAHPQSPRILDSEDIAEQEYSQAAELAWEYCNKVRHGQNPKRNDYYARLHNAESKEEFNFLIGMNEFVGHFVENHVVNSGS